MGAFLCYHLFKGRNLLDAFLSGQLLRTKPPFRLFPQFVNLFQRAFSKVGKFSDGTRVYCTWSAEQQVPSIFQNRGYSVSAYRNGSEQSRILHQTQSGKCRPSDGQYGRECSPRGEHLGFVPCPFAGHRPICKGFCFVCDAGILSRPACFRTQFSMILGLRQQSYGGGCFGRLNASSSAARRVRAFAVAVEVCHG